MSLLTLRRRKSAAVTYDYLIDALSLTSYEVRSPAGTLLGTYTNTGSTSGLKAAIDSVKANGKHLYFAPGKTFRFLDNVQDQDHATFNTLTGMTFSSSATNRATIENTSNVTVGDTEPLSFTNCDNATVKNLIINGMGAARSTTDALDFDNCDNVLVENVKIIGSRGAGIAFDGKDPGATGINCWARNCEITGTQGTTAGHGIRFLGATGGGVDTCNIHDNPGHGVQITKGAGASGVKCTGVSVIGSSIERNGRDGVQILSGDACIIGTQAKPNIIRDNSNITSTKDGVRIETADGVTADDNVIEYNTITDTRITASKTQDYGVDIRPTLATEANRTIVRFNVLTGNKTGSFNNGGTSSTISDNT